MSKYYLKKASRQDVGRTTVINTEAVASFFKVSVPNRDDSATISLRYLPDNIIVEDVNIIKKQDARIYLGHKRFQEGDILIFESKENGEFTLSIKTSSDPDYTILNSMLRHNFLLADDLTKKTLLEDGDDSEKEYKTEIMKQPLNQILYGPPGTGKTYATVEKSLEILDLKTDDNSKNRELFRSLINKKIFFITMHPSYSYEDFVQGIKPMKPNKGVLLFENRPGIFKVVSEMADISYNNCCLKVNPKSQVDFETIFKYTFKSLIYGEVSFVEIPRPETPFKIIDINERRLRFETSTGVSSPTYNISIETLKKIYDKGKNEIILSGNATYYNSLLDYLNLKSKEFASEIVNSEEENMVGNSNYVLILDEINRANISKVFGELITLIEEDKRIGNENELSVTLPSGERFSVPPNLYIIGTMNTADKSIALVDIALRRRFQFIPMYPDSSVIMNFCKSEDRVEKAKFMVALNSKLRVDKGVDFQIGHAYFLKENTLNDVINENIIPLLVEYMRNDLEKVKKLLFDLGTPIDEEYYSKTGLLKM